MNDVKLTLDISTLSMSDLYPFIAGSFYRNLLDRIRYYPFSLIGILTVELNYVVGGYISYVDEEHFLTLTSDLHRQYFHGEFK